MSTFPWQLTDPIDAVLFDCDSTLSAIEGIDILAKNNGSREAVQSLTKDAMGKTGIHAELYQKRLALVQPTAEQVKNLGQSYFDEQVPGIAAVLPLLRRLNKTVYIISAGLLPAVVRFGELLDVPRENIFAVAIHFDQQGHYLDYDHQSPLIKNEGKGLIINQLKARHPSLAYIGDGLNDLVARDLVTRFIGYGGVVYREKVELHCQHYIYTPSLLPVLPLLLTATEAANLLPHEQTFYEQGVTAIEEGGVKVPTQTVNDKRA